MKSTNNSNSTEEPTTKTGSGKTTKKTTKSRSKTTKAEANNKSGSSGLSNASNNNNNNSNSTVATTATAYPTTPKTTMTTGSSHESPSFGGSGGNKETEGSSSSSRSVHKNFAGLEARSVKIIWEQHDQSDIELSADVCTRLAEDASYKLWEIINSIKTYARHSGGVVTYDLVNEVMRDADVPPLLGAMESDWDRIDYDGSYFFFSDKILELRDEYQKDVTMTMPAGPDFTCSWPVDDKHVDVLKKYIPAITYVALYGDRKSLDAVITEVAYAPVMGSCCRVLIAKIIQILAFKQNDPVSLRCWTLLRALAFNPYTRDVDCRVEYFHLTEILICQLLAPYETIKVHSIKVENDTTQQSTDPSGPMKMETDEINQEIPQEEIKNEFTDEEMFTAEGVADMQPQPERIYKLEPDNDDNDDDIANMKLGADTTMTSAYFASPVDWIHVDTLCLTIGQLGVANGFFQYECLHHILRRLQRFFDGRNVHTEREYTYISRAIRGLISLGELAFREFIPFIYKFDAGNVPSNLWTDFAPAAIFLKGSEDIFLYEWLEYLCGADKIQPFMVYYAQYHEKLLTYRFVNRRKATFKICSKVVGRRLEWNSLAATMCQGDDLNKAIKVKPVISDYFPELVAPNLQLNRAGTIRFKFAGCRPVIIKPKAGQQKMKPAMTSTTLPETQITGATTPQQKYILIARRKLLKPLTNEQRIVPLSSYYFTRV